VITPALMMGLGDLIIDRIAFGGVKELEDLYAAESENASGQIYAGNVTQTFGHNNRVSTNSMPTS
jgi:hypothetical protein